MSDDQVEESMEKLQQKAREKEHKTEEKGYWREHEKILDPSRGERQHTGNGRQSELLPLQLRP